MATLVPLIATLPLELSQEYANSADDLPVGIMDSAASEAKRARIEAPSAAALENPSAPTNVFVKPMLTDLYQITMCYSYWKNGKSDEWAVFDLFFRKNPFGGEFTIFAGLEECLRYVASFRFEPADIAYLKSTMPEHVEDDFFKYLASLDASKVKLYAMEEGNICFPKTPLIRIEGPLPVAQLLETTLLVLVNFPSLIATNAARYRIAAGDKLLYEFGLRRAQGPDGAMSASRYAYLGGVDATSNVLAGQMYNIPVIGTHAHSYVEAFKSLSVVVLPLKSESGETVAANFADVVVEQYGALSAALESNGRPILSTNQGELAAFTAYAASFPRTFLALIDTYDVLRSGVLNYIVVALALRKCGYIARGVRLDSGDLAYLSRECRAIFAFIAEKMAFPELAKSIIVGSNEINEQTIYSIRSQENSLDVFAVGTHLVTCQTQPALGAVYKLVENKGVPCMKLSAELEKVTIPGRKDAYRIYGKDGRPICDLMLHSDEKAPVVGQAIMCRHPFLESKRASVIPTRVESLLHLFWDGKLVRPLPTLAESRARARAAMQGMRADYVRALNPTPYKVSVSSNLYNFTHELWLASAPVGILT
eukprot:m.236033 g.236033  ORF g.236033 m.236033 type:complete len:594 (+) comp12918_c0_seq1:81-1862(+)